MCGIFGYLGTSNQAGKTILEGLKSLEYRGYDSWGLALKIRTRGSRIKDQLFIEKHVGKIGDATLLQLSSFSGIGHTRWATHGGVTEENAHPHTDCNGEIFIVHNGIIDNYLELKKELIVQKHTFHSQTDSEVISHFFEEELKRTDMKDAVKKFFRLVKGEFAVMLIRKGDSNVYAFKRGSPLVLGIADGMNILASDIYAF